MFLLSLRRSLIAIKIYLFIFPIFYLFPFVRSTDKPIPNRFVDDVSLSVYQTKHRPIETSLFTAASRPQHIQQMYEKAAATLPVSIVPHMGNTGIGSRSSNSNGRATANNVDGCFLMRCSPVLGAVRHKITKNIDTEIETRIVSVSLSHSFYVSLPPSSLRLSFVLK